MIIQCCKCKAIKVKALAPVFGAGYLGWADPVDPDPSQPFNITPRYCPACAKALEAEVEQLEARQ